MTKPICGKVARVLNEREIAINVGAEKGVTIGMRFNVMEIRDEDIRDPDTDEMLGPIERSKVRVEVTHVQERLSVATTYRGKQVNIGGSGGLGSLGPFARSLMPPKWVKKYETLRKTENPRAKFDDLDEEGSYVKIGDLVVQVIEEVNTKGEGLTEDTKALSPVIED